MPEGLLGGDVEAADEAGLLHEEGRIGLDGGVDLDSQDGADGGVVGQGQTHDGWVLHLVVHEHHACRQGGGRRGGRQGTRHSICLKQHLT